ncbi:MAG: aminotransferase class III-fold pyridoxal phosphate-dependent enzyme [Acidimicrobiales bacterium]
MPADGQSNQALFDRARAVIPGGVNTPVRAFKAVGGSPYFVARARGPHVWDVEGRQFIDYVQSWGASILGHAHPAVIEALVRAAGDGTSYGAPTEREVFLAEAIAARVPSCQKVRLVSSGTEAVMTAVRVARGYTGRSRIVVFSGCYHGHADTLLAAGGSGMATLGLPATAGVPASAVADTVVVPYNQVPDLAAAAAQARDSGPAGTSRRFGDLQPPADDPGHSGHAADDGGGVAAVVVEPVAANNGLIPPVPGFLEGLRRATTEAGALLIFDEVITGFRLGLGGAQGAFGVTPDLTCLGKVIGGGLPLAAVGGRAEVMDVLAPDGPVYQAGTLSGNPLATAAGLAVLEELDDSAYVSLGGRAAHLAAGLHEVVTAAGLVADVPVVGPLLGLRLAWPDGPGADGNWPTGTGGGDPDCYAAFFTSLLARGVALAPSPYEVLFPSLAHGPDELERTIDAAASAARAALDLHRRGR